VRVHINNIDNEVDFISGFLQGESKLIKRELQIERADNPLNLGHIYF